MSKRYLSGLAAVAAIMVLGPATGGSAPVASTAEAYQLCGRVFPDPHAYWPAPAQGPARSPFAKGNAACAAVDFVSYQGMIDGLATLEALFPQFVEVYNLEEDFGDGSDCATSVSQDDLCSAGLPRQGLPPGRERSDLYMVRLTDERVPDTDKKFFTFPLSIHGIERAGAEAGVRIAEDLATWAYCEALAGASFQLSFAAVASIIAPHLGDLTDTADEEVLRFNILRIRDSMVVGTTELSADLAVSRDAAGVIVGGTRYQSRPKRPEQPGLLRRSIVDCGRGFIRLRGVGTVIHSVGLSRIVTAAIALSRLARSEGS